MKIFFSQPWPWLALVGTALLLMLVLSLLPFLGLVAIFTLFPVMAAGFLLASRAAMEGQAMRFPHLLAGFKTAGRPLLALGGKIFLIFFLGLVFIWLGWREEFQRFVELMQSPTPDKAAILGAAQHLTPASLLALAFMLLLAIATWFAPALVVFGQVDARTALLLSLRACLRNFAPFLVFGVLLIALDLVISLFLRLVLTLLHGIGGDQVANIATMFFTFPIVCAFMAIIFAAAYVSYRDVFEPVSASSPSLTPEGAD